MALSLPEYYFTTEAMNALMNNYDKQGLIVLPRALGSNIKDKDSKHLFHFDGHQTKYVELDTKDFEHYKTYSMYHVDGLLFIVDYDATEHQVGEVGPSAHTEDSDTESDDIPFEDWQKISFQLAPYSMSQVSYIGLHKERPTLLAQHANHVWATQLLPHVFQDRPRNYVQNSDQGGLVGELPVLIALVVMSSFPEQVRQHVPAVIRAGKWQVPPPGQVPQGAGWDNPRGIVVTVFHPPGVDTVASKAKIESYENGDCGTMLL